MRKKTYLESDIEWVINRYELETDEGGTPREKAIEILERLGW
jgi:hypothetical protein